MMMGERGLTMSVSISHKKYISSLSDEALVRLIRFGTQLLVQRLAEANENAQLHAARLRLVRVLRERASA